MKNSKNSQQSKKFHRQSGTARILPVFVILLVAALGALAAPQYEDRDRGYDRGRYGGALTVSRESTALDFGGGNGGRPAPDALCEPDSVAVGFHVQTGEYFNEAWLDCARIRRDGRLGRETSMTQRTGSPGRPSCGRCDLSAGFRLAWIARPHWRFDRRGHRDVQPVGRHRLAKSSSTNANDSPGLTAGSGRPSRWNGMPARVRGDGIPLHERRVHGSPVDRVLRVAGRSLGTLLVRFFLARNGRDERPFRHAFSPPNQKNCAQDRDRR